MPDLPSWAGSAPAWDGSRVTTVQEALEEGVECFSAPLYAHEAVPGARETDELRVILLPANTELLANADSRVVFLSAPVEGSYATVLPPHERGKHGRQFATEPPPPPSEPLDVPAHHTIVSSAAFVLMTPAAPTAAPPDPTVLRDGWGPAAALALRPPPPPVAEGGWRLPRRPSMLLAEFLGLASGFSCACRAGYHAMQPPHPVLSEEEVPVGQFSEFTLRQALLRARNPLFPAPARLKAAALREISAHCRRPMASRLLLPGGREDGSWAELVAATRHSRRLRAAVLDRMFHSAPFNHEGFHAAMAPLVEACDGDLVTSLRRFVAQFAVPGEASIIDVILQVFAMRWAALNPDALAVRRSTGPKAHDSVFMLTYSILMTSADAFSDRIPRDRKMTETQSIRNNFEVLGGEHDEEAEQYYRELYRAVVDAEQPVIEPWRPWEKQPAAPRDPQAGGGRCVVS